MAANGNGKGAQGLAEDVRYYGQWMRDEAEKRIGHLYPKAKLPDGTEATVVAWLWARTVRSPDPGREGRDGSASFNFHALDEGGKEAWVAPVIDPSATDGWRFEVRTGQPQKADVVLVEEGDQDRPIRVCVHLEWSVHRIRLRARSCEVRGFEVRLMAVVAEGAPWGACTLVLRRIRPLSLVRLSPRGDRRTRNKSNVTTLTVYQCMACADGATLSPLVNSLRLLRFPTSSVKPESVRSSMLLPPHSPTTTPHCMPVALVQRPTQTL